MNIDKDVESFKEGKYVIGQNLITKQMRTIESLKPIVFVCWGNHAYLALNQYPVWKSLHKLQ